MPNAHPWPDYIIRHGLLLSCAQAAAALTVRVWADCHPLAFPFLRRCAGGFLTGSTIVLCASLAGALLLEDLLRKTSPDG